MKSLSFTLQSVTNPSQTSAQSVSLHQLVNSLMSSYVPAAVNQKSFIINDVDKAFQLQANEEVLAFIVGNLLNNAISSSHNACIRIEAVKQPQGILIRVKNNGAHFYSTVSNGFAQAVAAARTMGGNINIYNQRHEGTVITLSVAA